MPLSTILHAVNCREFLFGGRGSIPDQDDAVPYQSAWILSFPDMAGFASIRQAKRATRIEIIRKIASSAFAAYLGKADLEIIDTLRS